VGGPTVVAPAVLRRLRTSPRSHVRRHRGGGLLDRRLEVEVGPVHGWGHTTKKMRPCSKGRSPSCRRSTSAPTSSPGLHHVEGGDPEAPRSRSRRCHVGDRLPDPEGSWPNTASKLKTDFCEVPVPETKQLLGATAAKVYGFDLDALLTGGDRIGPHLRTWDRTRRWPPTPMRRPKPSGGWPSTASRPRAEPVASDGARVAYSGRTRL